MILNLMLAIENDDDRDFMIRLYKDYVSLMYYTANNLIYNADDIEDIVHDVVEKLIINIDTLKDIDRLVMPSYISVCVKRACYNHLEHKKVVDKHTAFCIGDDKCDKFDPTSSSEVENEFIMQLDALQLRNVIKDIPEKYKDVLEFKYILELTDEEIAGHLGIKKNSVREYLTRARRYAYGKIMEQKNEHDK